MRFLFFFRTLTLPIALLAGGCASRVEPPEVPEAPPSTVPRTVACEAPRPQVCTMIYLPVCAEHTDGRLETHASACNACADDTVIAYRNDACEDAAAL